MLGATPLPHLSVVVPCYNGADRLPAALAQLTAWLEAQPYVDATRMAAAGASYGGYMMNWFQGHTDRFKTLISHCGVYNFDTMYGTTDELWFDEWEHGGHPYYEAPEEFEKWNPVNHVAKWKTPMLVITGEKDFRIPYTQGLAAFTALQRRGVPSRLLVNPNENHWVLKPANSRQWYREVLGWMDRWTKDQR